MTFIHSAAHYAVIVALVATLGVGESAQDVGPAADIRAVRAVMSHYIHRGPAGEAHIGPIRVVGRWAAAPWVNDGGGTAVLERAGGRWRFLTGGGGLVCPRDLTKYMPLQTARELLGASHVRDCKRFGG
jgi:hypothetical protein